MTQNNKSSQSNSSRSILENLLEGSLCFILAAIVGLTFIQVLFRYVFHFSLAWSEELARYLFLWLAALAAAYGFKTRSHFVLRFLVNRMGKRLQRITGASVVLITSLFLVIFTQNKL